MSYNQRVGIPWSIYKELPWGRINAVRLGHREDKIETIKVVRNLSSIGLKEAKDLVENLNGMYPDPKDGVTVEQLEDEIQGLEKQVLQLKIDLAMSQGAQQAWYTAFNDLLKSLKSSSNLPF